MAHAHAGTVIGGVIDARSPCRPESMSLRMFGISSAKSRNSSCGVPQSRPMTATRGPCGMCDPSLAIGASPGARRGASRKGAWPHEGRAPEAGPLYPLVRRPHQRERGPRLGHGERRLARVVVGVGGGADVLPLRGPVRVRELDLPAGGRRPALADARDLGALQRLAGVLHRVWG